MWLRTVVHHRICACLFGLYDFSYKKVEKVYKPRSERKVLDFEEQTEKKLIDIAQDRPRTVFFALDEAGLYLQATTSFVWSVVGETPIVRVDPGRKQTHFYGALNLLSGREIAFRSDTMSSEITAQFLLSLLESIPEDLLVVVFWDRAPWHRGEEVAKVLRDNPRPSSSQMPARI